MKRSALLAFLLLGVVGLHAAPVRQGPVEAELVSPAACIRPGKPFTVALRLKHDAHWHSYWLNPGSGKATTLTWQLPPGFTAAELEWPAPQILRDAAGRVTGYGYEGETFLLVQMTAPADLVPGKDVTLRAHAEWLATRDTTVAGQADLALKLPVKAKAITGNPQWTDRIAACFDRLPVSLPDQWAATAVRGKDTVELHLQVASGVKPKPNTLHFITETGLIDYAQPQTVQVVADGYVLQLPLAKSAAASPVSLTGVLCADRGWGGDSGLGADTGLRIDVLLPGEETSISAGDGTEGTAR